MKIFALTMPRLSFLLHSIHLRTRPRVKSSVLVILWFGCGSGVGELRSFLFLYIYVGFCCLFAPFAHLSSFDPGN
ncbi:hypothetical protein Hanom_Chr05g00432381 [Helianthus anomalus]